MCVYVCMCVCVCVCVYASIYMCASLQIPEYEVWYSVADGSHVLPEYIVMAQRDPDSSYPWYYEGKKLCSFASDTHNCFGGHIQTKDRSLQLRNAAHTQDTLI